MRNIKKYLGYLVIVLTVIGFGLYIKLNPSVTEQLAQTKLSTIGLVLFLYSFMTLVLVFISRVVLRLSDMVISDKENTLLTMYSSVVNFFGPLQSGPGFRIVYLKKKHDINIKKYLKANILYYMFFAVVSGLFILSGVISFGLVALLGVGFVLVLYFFPSILKRLPLVGNNKMVVGASDIASKFRLDLLKLAGLTLLQLLTITGVYFVELRSIDATINFGQALIYAGAANFSLFVSLTPGALGFRESFLFFSQRLHQIDSDVIVATSILDRALFILFLGLMMLVILAVHGRQLLSVGRSKA